MSKAQAALAGNKTLAMHGALAAARSGSGGDLSAEQRVIINIALGNDNEPRRIFIGADGYECVIERGKDVAVPVRVLNVLDDAIVDVKEEDPDDPDKYRFVQRKRFAYTVIGLATQ